MAEREQRLRWLQWIRLRWRSIEAKANRWQLRTTVNESGDHGLIWEDGDIEREIVARDIHPTGSILRISNTTLKNKVGLDEKAANEGMMG
ncbi:hypothetical protein L2E82_51552 [Cichorium intybus]|nr:hypothetical protein L2E82_51552 [Cichorium intybus]